MDLAPILPFNTCQQNDSTLGGALPVQTLFQRLLEDRNFVKRFAKRGQRIGATCGFLPYHSIAVSWMWLHVTNESFEIFLLIHLPVKKLPSHDNIPDQPIFLV